MTRQQDEMKYRSKFEPTFQIDYPVRLVASLAVQILGPDISLNDDQAYFDAAKCACKLIDASHNAASQHYSEVNGLMPLIRDQTHESFEKVAKDITGHKKRPKDAIESFEEYLIALADQFCEVDDDETVSPNDPKSAAYTRMLAALADYKAKGVPTSAIAGLTRGYKEWKERTISEVRATAGGKGGKETAQRRQPQSVKTGKYKKKDKFSLTPAEVASLNAKASTSLGKNSTTPKAG